MNTDVVGPYDISIDRRREALIVGDAASQYIWFIPVTRKANVTNEFIALLRRIEREFPGQLQIVRTDNGGEFVNSKVKQYTEEQGIKHEKSIAYIHAQNGRAENNNKMVLQGIRALLYSSGLPIGYWTFAGKAFVASYNVMRRKDGTQSPWEFFYHSKPDLERLRVFGVKGYSHVSREARRKLDATSVPVIFLGYAEDSLGYIVEHEKTGRRFYTRTFFCDEEAAVPRKRLLDATGEYITNTRFDPSVPEFEETESIEAIEAFNSGEIQANLEEYYAPRVSTEETSDNAQVEATTISQNSIERENVSENIDDQSEESQEEQYQNFCDISEDNIVEGPRTRSGHAKSAYILKALRRVFLRYRLAMKAKRGRNGKGFRSYKEAVIENKNWEKAYKKEIEKLEKIGGLKVVKKEGWMKPLPFVEVLTQKVDNVTGQLKLKVRLAARGDLERKKPEICYSPAAGTSEMRLFICLMKLFKAHVFQADVPSAYLNGRLEEKIYLFLPEGHEEKDEQDSRVYSCPSSIYGLSVAGRVWYYTFVKEVKKFNFTPLDRAPTMFIKVEEGEVAYLQLYVDDFLCGSTSKKLLNKCEEFFRKTFNIKCTYKVEKFVGLQLNNSSKGLFLHQEEMISEIGLKRRVDKVYSTPLVLNLKWNKSSTNCTDVRKLQAMFGELNYVAGLSRPDISYSVNRIARRLHDPSKEVVRSAKRIIGYLQGTNNLGLKIKYSDRAKEEWQIKLYTDSSFADIESEKFKSTGGFMIFLEDNLIGWKSKKLRYVCTSSGEAEYLAAYVGSKEALYLAYLLLEGFKINVFPILLYCDNKAVVDTLKAARPGEMTKHMATKYFKLKEWCERGLVKIIQVASKENVADLMTKVDSRFGHFQRMVLQPRGSGQIEQEVQNIEDTTVVDSVGSSNIEGTA